MPPYTTEHFFNNAISVSQPENGYRFSVDPVILAAHAPPQPGERIVDLGTGCGIMPLILSHRYPETRITGIELQEELATLARKNMAENRVSGRISILTKDIRTLGPSDLGGCVDLVITNPPYKKKKSGRINPDPQKAIARHEIELTLAGLLETTARILTPGGRFIIIFPADRLGELMQGMEQNSMGPGTARFVHTQIDGSAKRVILTGIKNQHPSFTVLPPLFLQDSKKNSTKEMNCMFNA
ncbi:MAG: tRNA1(Val) (adenine(37)-N6)-methyltransferase [Desulfobacterium sp.]|nr:tRNA1(Val) (adenine(37)-N6)-methyltransferase [Desulfobacterium sp.]